MKLGHSALSHPLTVYIDFKSPYAYLAIEPTRHMARDLGISINWQPFVLDIPSYLGSAKLGKAGQVAEQARSADQWSKVKYAYYDCRRYANLRGVTVRGTIKIWDTNLAAMGMLWAKGQSDDILNRYIDAIFVPFWKRELEIDDQSVIEQVLASIGAQVDGFAEFICEAGLEANQRIQEEAFDRGIFGVPTFIVGDDLYFGREHLPRIRWQLTGANGPAPDIACELLPDDVVERAAARTLEAGISQDDPESYAAIPEILKLAEEIDIAVEWSALPRRGPGRTAEAPDRNRSTRHRQYRTENRQRDQERYITDMPKNLSAAIDSLLANHGVRLIEKEVAVAWAGMASLSGYVGSPVFKLGEETFVGRQHLPLIRARLGL